MQEEHEDGISIQKILKELLINDVKNDINDRFKFNNKNAMKMPTWNGCQSYGKPTDVSHDIRRRLPLKIYSVNAMGVIDCAVKHISTDYQYFEGRTPFKTNVLAGDSPRFFNYDHMAEDGEFFLVKESLFIKRNEYSSSSFTSTEYFDLGLDFMKIVLESYRCKCIAELKFKELIPNFTYYSDLCKRDIIGVERILRHWDGTENDEDKAFVGRPLNPFEQERLKSLIIMRNSAMGATETVEKIDMLKTFLNEINN